MSMASVAAGLRTVLDGIARTRAGAAAGIEAAIRARDRLTAVTASSRHPLVDQALQHVTAAIERLQAADQDAALAAAALVAYGRTLGISLPVPPPVSAPTRGAAPVPSWIRQAGQDLPTRPDDHGPTHGQAFDSTGRPLSAEPWRSGRNIASTSDLRPIPGLKGFRGRSPITWSHVPLSRCAVPAHRARSVSWSTKSPARTTRTVAIGYCDTSSRRVRVSRSTCEIRTLRLGCERSASTREPERGSCSELRRHVGSG